MAPSLEREASAKIRARTANAEPDAAESSTKKKSTENSRQKMLAKMQINFNAWHASALGFRLT